MNRLKKGVIGILILLLISMLNVLAQDPEPPFGVNGCNEGCNFVARTERGEHRFCYEDVGDIMWVCDCSRAEGGLRYGGGQALIASVYRDRDYSSLYCTDCDDISTFRTGRCHYDNKREATFDYRGEEIHPKPKESKCLDQDDEVRCDYETPYQSGMDNRGRWRRLIEPIPTRVYRCYNLENARWDPPAQLSACGTSSGVSAIIGATGGSITLTTSFVRLDIPPNALEGSGTFEVVDGELSGTIITISHAYALLKNNDMFNIIAAYNFYPENTDFKIPATITVNYDGYLIKNEDNLDLAFWNGAEWVPQNIMVDRDTGTLAMNITSLGNYALIEYVDEEPPEAVIRFNTTTKQLEVTGKDNIDKDVEVIVKEACLNKNCQRSERVYTLKDDANNKLILTINYSTAGNQIKAELIKADYYVNGELELAKEFNDNQFNVEYTYTKNELNNLNQKLTVKDNFETHLVYNKNKEESHIIIYEQGEEKQNYKEEGLVMLEAVTDKGEVGYGLSKVRKEGFIQKIFNTLKMFFRFVVS